jgi:hypothetical protein
VVLEVVADHDLWIWHLCFGMVGPHNAINMLQRSLMLARLVNTMLHLASMRSMATSITQSTTLPMISIQGGRYL